MMFHKNNLVGKVLIKYSQIFHQFDAFHFRLVRNISQCMIKYILLWYSVCFVFGNNSPSFSHTNDHIWVVSIKITVVHWWFLVWTKTSNEFLFALFCWYIQMENHVTRWVPIAQCVCTTVAVHIAGTLGCVFIDMHRGMCDNSHYHTCPCAYQWFQGCACKVCETHRLKVKWQKRTG